MQAEYLKRWFEIKDDLHRLIPGIENKKKIKNRRTYDRDNYTMRNMHSRSCTGSKEHS